MVQAGKVWCRLVAEICCRLVAEICCRLVAEIWCRLVAEICCRLVAEICCRLVAEICFRLVTEICCRLVAGEYFRLYTVLVWSHTHCVPDIDSSMYSIVSAKHCIIVQRLYKVAPPLLVCVYHIHNIIYSYYLYNLFASNGQ